MKRATHFLQSSFLILVAGLLLMSCNHGSGETRYVNKTNPAETLTLNGTTDVKEQLIYTFHGVSQGTYTLTTDKGTATGKFSSDSSGVKFRPENGKAETVKPRADGSFDYAQATWQLASSKKEMSLKSLASSSK